MTTSRWFMKGLKTLGSEDGFLPLFFALMLPVILFAWGLAIDFGRAHVAREELQTAVDSASLAAASTAVAVPSVEARVIYDPDGNVTGVEEVVTGWRAEIQDEVKAAGAARQLFWANAGGLTLAAGVDFDMDKDWEGTKVTDDSYQVRAGVRVKAPWGGAAAVLLWGDWSFYRIPVSAAGTGRAVAGEIN